MKTLKNESSITQYALVRKLHKTEKPARNESNRYLLLIIAPLQFMFSNQLQRDLEQLIELEAYILQKKKDK